jgi:4-diphosphocytidyl-2-C-methyl-D-erythritol kinase
VVLAIPGYGVPTAWAYAELDRLRARRPALTSFRLSPKILGAALRRAELDKVAALVRNDFEPVVFRKHPDLARARELMLERGAFAAALSGSGSTVYGLVRAHGWKDPMAALCRHGFRSLHTRTT